MIMALKIESDKGPQHELAPELSQRLVLSHLADLFEKGLPKKARELMKDETATRQEVALALYRDLGKNARVAKKSGETAIRTLLLKWCINLYSRWASGVTNSSIR
jgi:hypothetical protein